MSSVDNHMDELANGVLILQKDDIDEDHVSHNIFCDDDDGTHVLLDIKRDVAELQSAVAQLRADLPGIIANAIAPLLGRVAKP